MKLFNVFLFKNFKGGLHLSRGLTNAYDKSLDTLHSDTIKSALFVCALSLYGSEQVGEGFLKSFKISSAFPFFNSQTRGERLYFFPKPEIDRLPLDVRSDVGKEKKLKKLEYLEKSLFEQLIAGQSATLSPDDFSGKYAAAPAVQLRATLLKENCEHITRSHPFQHVAISRDHSTDSEPYYVDKIFFHNNAGLFFLVEAEGETIDMLKAAMRLLADNGIGTDRNVGNGQFEASFDQIELNLPAQADYEMALSLYCPQREEVGSQDMERAYFSLIKRGGYVSSPEREEHQTLRKKSIYMFGEGSIFPKYPNRKGKIVDLKPEYTGFDHPVWRDGQAIFLPYKAK